MADQEWRRGDTGRHYTITPEVMPMQIRQKYPIKSNPFLNFYQTVNEDRQVFNSIMSKFEELKCLVNSEANSEQTLTPGRSDSVKSRPKASEKPKQMFPENPECHSSSFVEILK